MFRDWIIPYVFIRSQLILCANYMTKKFSSDPNYPLSLPHLRYSRKGGIRAESKLCVYYGRFLCVYWCVYVCMCVNPISASFSSKSRACAISDTGRVIRVILVFTLIALSRLCLSFLSVRSYHPNRPIDQCPRIDLPYPR